MGLATTHDCFCGPYSAFNRWRLAVLRAAGFAYVTDDGYRDGSALAAVAALERDGSALAVLLGHSDCDGQIDAAVACDVADELERVAPRLQRDDRDVADRWIDGLRAAWAAGEAVVFS